MNARQRRQVVNFLLLTGIVSVLIVSGGCQKTIPGETHRHITTAWPIYDLDKSEGVHPDGTRWYKEKGDAVAWLASWEKEKTYDEDGVLIYRMEKSAFFPIYATEEEETDEYMLEKGSVLIFPYYKRTAKQDEPPVRVTR